MLQRSREERVLLPEPSIELKGYSPFSMISSPFQRLEVWYRDGAGKEMEDIDKVSKEMKFLNGSADVYDVINRVLFYVRSQYPADASNHRRLISGSSCNPGSLSNVIARSLRYGHVHVNFSEREIVPVLRNHFCEMSVRCRDSRSFSSSWGIPDYIIHVEDSIISDNVFEKNKVPAMRYLEDVVGSKGGKVAGYVGVILA